ncbi:T6SS amidase immunity protein Tai4 family protein [Pseudomonas kitaguniensis]|uniref:T6SS amidase immunity protein Tai4 family protein n=1 Tax=Pseudomonas kitaguniensis TaxID=2607908 RepID=UPI00313464FB
MRKKLALLLLTVLGAVNSAYGADIAAARQSLKNYGLAHCIADRFPDKSDVRDDIGAAIGMYGFMGSGMHTIIQNEDTLETLHDPYAATGDYISSVYDSVSANSKHRDKKVVFYACLKIYNSKDLDRFIKDQDKYIRQ